MRHRIDEALAAEAWREFGATRGGRHRNRLAELYLPLVREIAARIHRTLPASVEFGDLLTAATFGLLDAIEKFRPERAVRFETYCQSRVRGAIFDELRAMDWLPRLTRQRGERYRAANRALRAERGRAPTRAEVGQRLGLPPKEVDRLVAAARLIRPLSLSWRMRRPFEGAGRDLFSAGLIVDRRQGDPLAQAMAKLDFATLLRPLPRVQRAVMVLIYREQLTMKETGRAIGMSESRVSQLHAMAIEVLRSSLTPPPACEDSELAGAFQ